ncbi:MAG: hypothetical protein M3Y87_32270, partial [Myxococcota bacterium]|nr:hypothetical protein [Myxococcota bacterium]
MTHVARRWALLAAVVASLGCQTETCPPGVTDSIFCRNGPDASLDGCVGGAPCSPPDDLCASGVMRCELSGPRCEVTGRLAEGDPCGDGTLTCGADGTCSVCADGALCNTGNPCLGGHVDCGAGAPVCIADTPMDGMMCGTGGVCGGEVCSECIPDLLCNTGNPCTTGHTTCPDASTTICEPDTDLPRGINCGAGLVCDGSGTCSVCSPGAVCNTGNPCTTGHIDCGSGDPVCIVDGEVTPGAGCGSGGICSGAGECSECVAGTVCNTGNPCTVGQVMCPASGGTICAIASNLPAGVRCGVGMACDGAGSCSTCIPGDPCVTGTCETGAIDCSGGSAVCVGAGMPAATGAVCRPRVDVCDVA